MANSTVIARDNASVRGAACPSCGSVNQRRFPAEMAIHFSGLKNVNKPTVWLFPEVLVVWIVASRNLPSRRPNCVYL
jgi:hypothetical protein